MGSALQTEGHGQGRGNSGVFFGRTRYEIQVLDSYQNPTYADGSAGSVYGQYAPLVNVSRPPGEWQSYDILYTAPGSMPKATCSPRPGSPRSTTACSSRTMSN
jgi:hypothetical protein